METSFVRLNGIGVALCAGDLCRRISVGRFLNVGVAVDTGECLPVNGIIETVFLDLKTDRLAIHFLGQ
jgi:hypothetical protein